MDKALKEKRLLVGIAITLTIAIAGFMMATVDSYAAVDESEYNDSKAVANQIKMGEYVYGDTYSINSHNYVDYDEDWFKFKAPISGTAKIKLYVDDYVDYESDGLDVYVKDSDNNELTSLFDSYDTSAPATATFPVTCGKTYYIQCYGSDGLIGIYREVGYHLSVGYNIVKTSISLVKSKDNAFYVKWNKKSKASFYQVRYTKKSVYEDYGWSKAKTVKVSKKYSAKTVKKLANKRTYYVQVRVARTIDGKTYYSPWSNKKKVKTR